MRKIFKKLKLKKKLAILLAVILSFSIPTSVSAVDYVHNENNHHYLVYTDMNALFDKVVQAYNDNNIAMLGANIFLPVTEGVEITAGSEHLSEIQSKLTDKYLVDTIIIEENLVVYLTVNVETYEFYLLVYNETEEEHEFTLLFADGMEFKEVATAYSFEITEVLPIGEPTEAVSGGAITIPDGTITEPGDNEPTREEETDNTEGAEDTLEEDGEQPIEEPTDENSEQIDEDPTLDEGTPEESGDGASVDENSIEESDEQELQENNLQRLTTFSLTTGDFGGNDSNPDDMDEGTNEGFDAGTEATEEESGDADATDNSAEDTADDSTDDAADDSTNDNAEDAADNSAEDTADDSTDDSADDAADNSADDNTDNPADDSTENSSDDELGNEDQTGETPNEDDSTTGDSEEDPETENEEINPGSESELEDDLTGPALATLEIGMFMKALRSSDNTISLLSLPNTATATEFVYDSGELGPTISKSIEKNQDGTYTLTLTVTGNNDIIETPTPINLVLALDVSNSMYWSMNNTALAVGLDVSSEPQHIEHTNASPESRWRVLKRAVNQIVDDVLSVPGSQISIVMFSGDNASTNSSWDSRNFSVLKSWSSNKTSIKSTYENKELWELTYGSGGNFTNRFGAGGTNGEAGFLAAGLQLEQVKTNGNPNYVVYFSDGIANRYLSNNGNVQTINSDTAAQFQLAASEAIAVAKTLKTTYSAKIYTIGISNALTTSLGIQYCGYLLNPTGANKYQEAYYTAATSQSLSDALTAISHSITGNKLTNLVVTDQLSKYVNYVGALQDDGNGATIDADEKITWNVGSSLSATETRTMSYIVSVDNVASYQDEYQLTPSDYYTNNRDDLIGYYTENTDEKNLFFHSNEYARLDYTNLDGEPKFMNFTHPVVEPGERPNKLTIQKELQEGDIVPGDIEFEFSVLINGEPFSGNLISSTNKVRNVENGILHLNAGESVDIYVEINSDGSVVPYEITELSYTEEGVVSELVDVNIITGNGTREGNKVSGNLGTAGTPGSAETKYYYYTTSSEVVREGNRNVTYYTYKWYSSMNKVTWTKLNEEERTKNSSPILPFATGSYTTMTGYFDDQNQYVDQPMEIIVDYINGSTVNEQTLKVKNHSSEIIFYQNTDYPSNSYNNKYNNTNRYKYNNNNDYRTMNTMLNELGAGYTSVAYDQLGSSQGNNRRRKVYFYNPVTTKTLYVTTSTTPPEPASPSDVHIKFINSYQEIIGTITVHKSINDYYSAHGNPTFFYRLEKMNGNAVEATYYNYIEFELDDQTTQNIVDGQALNSKFSSIATSVIFDQLPAGTYVLTEEQPIRYEFGGVFVDNGVADTSNASSNNNARTIIVIDNNNSEVELTITNEKFKDNYFSHTDIVKNTVSIVSDPGMD
jgi:hypothetical protein